jgi:hypothetical protein
VQLLYKWFTESKVGSIDHQIDATEMICRLYNIIDVEWSMFTFNGVCFIDAPGLVMGKLTPFDMI